MSSEWMAIPAGILGGGLFLLGLYLLGRKRALKSGERPMVVFLRCLAFLGLMLGLGFVLITACVLFGVPILMGPIPAVDRDWMVMFILTGFVFVFLAGATLRWTGWFPGK